MASFILSNTFALDEIVYIICGIISIVTGVRGLKNKEGKIQTFLFWFILGLLFMFGGFIVKYTNSGVIVGIMLMVLGVISLTKKVKVGTFIQASDEERRTNANKMGNKIFIPALILAFLAVLMAQAKSFGIVAGKSAEGADLIFEFSTAQVLGFSSIVALIIAIIITKSKKNDIKEDTSRLLMQVGTSSILPQLLAALGIVFSEAGVGEIMGKIAAGVVGNGGIVVGVIVYCIAMVLFTMIMGNAFAAFTVITIGVGIPFIINQGGNPAVVGALGMTCGFCGTLMTPMAANFNIVPASILELKDNNKIIKVQAPLALALILVHIVLILLLAF